MSEEYRPRIRASRKSPVTRKGNVIVIVCDNDAQAEQVAAAAVYAMRFPTFLEDVVADVVDGTAITPA